MLQSDSVRLLRGVGPQMAEKLSRMDVDTLGSLLYLYPRRYSDRTKFQKIADTVLYENALLSVLILTPPKSSHIRKGLDLLKIRVGDSTGVMDVTFFNQSFLKSKLTEGTEIILYGKIEGDMVRRKMTSPECEFRTEGDYEGKLLPIYPLTTGVSQKQMRRFVAEAVRELLPQIKENLPRELRDKYALIDRGRAFLQIHEPKSEEELKAARRRLAFEELFCLQLGLMKLSTHEREQKGIRFDSGISLEDFFAALPFELTEGQKEAIASAKDDMCGDVSMNRLIQGDVGCGKTIVAAALIYFCVKNGCQAALMAPTELLAVQHEESLAPLLDAFGIRTERLTGSLSAARKRSVLEQLKNGEIDLAIGTQALIQKGVEFSRLGLVVADEQHRFGVAQRAKLTDKGENPHLLVMSATPIPRTLALMIYGDLDISTIRMMPKGRQKIQTTLIGEKKRKTLYSFLRGQVSEGRQIYVVCPLIEEDEEGESALRSAELTYLELSKKIFPDLRVSLVHGRMKGAEKDEIMEAFSAGNIDILVSTTVIEVGINVPNATVMVIENAERFGLSQLHQLRGRVGRGAHQSYCILVSEHENEKTRERLSTVVRTSDGFEIAEADLALRGPGDFFGSAQHGLPTLRLAVLTTDTRMVEVAALEARALLDKDPELRTVPLLAQSVERLFSAEKGNFLN